MTDTPPPPFLPEPVSDETFRALTFFFQPDPDAPLDARVVETSTFNRQFVVDVLVEDGDTEPHHTREKVVFNGLLGARVPGYLALPVGASQPLPCVLLLDGINGSKDRWWLRDAWPRGPLLIGALIDAGYAVLALDARLHGERSEVSDFEAPGQLLWGPSPRHPSLLQAIVSSVVECRRAIDYLETRPEIDSGRIGVLGQSMGGMQTFALTGVEPRLRAAVSCVIPMFPRQRLCPMTPHHHAARNDSIPLLMLTGREDGVSSLEEIDFLFEQVATPRKKHVFFDSGHRLPPEYVPEAVSWFREHLP
jgi:dienelactone hydrolase